ncbi:MAG: hypothetical protein K2L07_16845 [Lachnospiraceae bacterium]|nr:hypothetical protein [Lachnospiraceae bacterium]
MENMSSSNLKVFVAPRKQTGVKIMIDEEKLIKEIVEEANTKFNGLLSGISFEDVIKWIKEQPKIGAWILCKDKMPEEHDSIFAKFKGTDKWNASMFEKISDDVNVTVEFEDGKRKTMTLHTCDGKWKTDMRIVRFNVLAWQLLPDYYLD